MLIEFTVENWKSFRDPAGLSMLASDEHDHKERIARIGDYEEGVLQVAAVFGGNASGKSNFISALAFARKFIVSGSRLEGEIPVSPFSLDKKTKELPSKFHFLFVAEKKSGGGSATETMYEYNFSLTPERVVEERLIEHGPDNAQEILFDRQFKCKEKYGGELFSQAKNGKWAKELQRMKIVSQGTKPNRLFVTNAESQNVEIFQPVFDWFKSNLVVVSPEARFSGLERFFKADDPLREQTGELLSQLDSGIIELGLDEEELRGDLPARIGLSEGAYLTDAESLALLTKSEGKLISKSLRAVHLDSEGDSVQFGLFDESDGTQRLFQLLPAFVDLAKTGSRSIFVFDEFDRSLHPLLTKRLLDFYLSSSSAQTRHQLIFTSHNLQLMAQDKFRRDETWFTERNPQNDTRIFSLCEYEPEGEKENTLKYYLQGAYGGIPMTDPLFLGADVAKQSSGVTRKQVATRRNA